MNNQFEVQSRQGLVRILTVSACAAVVLLAGCGGDKKDKAASQTAAKVNKEEITVHQINFVLSQQRGLKPEQVESASNQVLEHLIDQELAVQKAGDLKVDRDPRVVQQLEAARREIISRAYFDKVGDGAGKPTADEVQKYYDEHPALFKERRVYKLQEIAIEATPDKVAAVKAALEAAKTLNDFVEYLKKGAFKFGGNQYVRAAEQLPLASLPAFSKLKDGEAMVNPAPAGLQVVYLLGSQSQPIEADKAKPVIEQYLGAEKKRKVVADDIKALRAAAKIQYVGKFAQPAASGAAAVAASAAEPASVPVVPAVAAPVAASAASTGLDSSSLKKGLGL